ncbi:MAG: hypothetical protein LBS04_02080 [Tannerellaceae bacterium]|nr:hypothetical protein [Tannerellaceae bacterium]
MAVTLQLAVSVAFIIAAWVVMMQMHFVGRKDVGFNRNGVIQLSGLLPQMERSLRTALIHELEAIPQIENVSISTFEPRHNINLEEMVAVVEWPGKPSYEKPAFNVIPTGSRFAGTFGLTRQACLGQYSVCPCCTRRGSKRPSGKSPLPFPVSMLRWRAFAWRR